MGCFGLLGSYLADREQHNMCTEGMKLKKNKLPVCLFPFIPSSFTNLIHNLHIIVSLFSLFLFKFSNSFQFHLKGNCVTDCRAIKQAVEDSRQRRLGGKGTKGGLPSSSQLKEEKTALDLNQKRTETRRDETSIPWWKCVIVSHPQCKRYTELKNWIIPEGIYVRSITKLRCRYPPLTHSIIFREVHIIKMRFLLLHTKPKVNVKAEGTLPGVVDVVCCIEFQPG